jgi:glycosyltransferase involved in cell wall biosynthesis
LYCPLTWKACHSLLLDAIGAGLCVFSSDVPENREAVEDAGFTFRKGDANDLADRLGFLIANPAVREAAGLAAKRRVRDQYLWSGIAREVERTYFDAMGWTHAEAPVRKALGASPLRHAQGNKERCSLAESARE